MSLDTRQQLKHLYEISTLLTRFENVDQTLPSILSLMTRTLQVRGAMLICDRSGRTLTTGWKAEGTSPVRARLDEAHAHSAYGYLTGVRATATRLGNGNGNGGDIANRAALSSRDLRTGMAAGERNNFVVLPLALEGGRTFGALQIEGDIQLDETDLLFVNAVVGQLSLALDRQAVLASKDAIVKASQLHAAQRFAELQQTERAQHFLADVSALLVGSLEYRLTLAAMLRRAVPFLADVCFADEVGEKGNVARIAATRAEGDDPELPALVSPDRGGREANKISERALLDWRQPQDEVLASCRSLLLPDPFDARISEALVHVMQAMGFGSMMVVPLRARGEMLGTLTFAIRGPRGRYSANDLGLAEDVAHRAAIAIDNAQLHRQAQRAIQARENILNIVSHDLRSPLNTLVVSAALLSEDLLTQDRTPENIRPLEIIQRTVKRMERMIGDLLDTASIDAGRLAIVKEEHLLHALVEEAIQGNKSGASRRSLQLEVRLPSQAIRVACDRGRILQVLSNLIGNAIKFTPKNGSIVVSAERIGDEVRVAVSDTGAGIEQTQLPRVFDRLFQANEANSIGTGLGLYISKGIIESHGGALWVESELHKGSTFFFTLPCT